MVEKINLILNDNYFISGMTFLTIFALFGDDVRVAFFNPSIDVLFFSIR